MTAECVKSSPSFRDLPRGLGSKTTDMQAFLAEHKIPSKGLDREQIKTVVRAIKEAQLASEGLKEMLSWDMQW